MLIVLFSSSFSPCSSHWRRNRSILGRSFRSRRSTSRMLGLTFQFLAGLAELWRQGEARPTHRENTSRPRDWRTRQDPFEKVWPEILLWLQDDPDASAKSLWERLDKKYPGQFPTGQLRTLQRRVRDWRRVMAH